MKFLWELAWSKIRAPRKMGTTTLDHVRSNAIQDGGTCHERRVLWTWSLRKRYIIFHIPIAEKHIPQPCTQISLNAVFLIPVSFYLPMPLSPAHHVRCPRSRWWWQHCTATKGWYGQSVWEWETSCGWSSAYQRPPHRPSHYHGACWTRGLEGERIKIFLKIRCRNRLK